MSTPVGGVAARAAPLRQSIARSRRAGATGFLFTIPALAAFGLLIFYPFLSALWLSLYHDTLTTRIPSFIGLRNFANLLHDPDFLAAWLTTIMFVAAATAVTVALGIAWAIILHQKFRGRTLLRSASLLPWVVPSTVTAFLWAWIFNAQFGILNGVLLSTGFIGEPIAWLASSGWAMVAVVVAKTWTSIPVVMVFALAGLQALPQEHVEAAWIDGAGNARVIRSVILPHLSGTIGVIVMLQAMANLQQFDIIYALTGGGPVRATSVLSIEVYRQAFQNWNLGVASAMGVFWFLTIAVPASLYIRSLFRD
ncbi:MAG: sugar ABC transporter permease [Rhodospirillales bacterium]|nr:sugar ABC transporter permease [Rhodospirillales bacterium]